LIELELLFRHVKKAAQIEIMRFETESQLHGLEIQIVLGTLNENASSPELFERFFQIEKVEADGLYVRALERLRKILRRALVIIRDYDLSSGRAELDEIPDRNPPHRSRAAHHRYLHTHDL